MTASERMGASPARPSALKTPGCGEHHGWSTCILTGGPTWREHGMWELRSAVKAMSLLMELYPCLGILLQRAYRYSPAAAQRAKTAALTTPSARNSLFIPSPMLQTPALKSGAAPVRQALTTTLPSCKELRHPQPGCSGTKLLLSYCHPWHLAPEARKTNT